MITILGMKGKTRVKVNIIIQLFCRGAIKPLVSINKYVEVVEFNHEIYYLVQEN